jgi:hypothetical protein
MIIVDSVISPQFVTTFVLKTVSVSEDSASASLVSLVLIALKDAMPLTTINVFRPALLENSKIPITHANHLALPLITKIMEVVLNVELNALNVLALPIISALLATS